MISVSKKVWSERKISQRLIDKFVQDYTLSPILAKIIISKKFSLEEIYSIKNKIYLKNVFKNNRDFISACEIIENSIKNNEKICIFGDYDVDGSCASTLLIKFLTAIKHPFIYYIPDREIDGYGPSIKVFEKLIKKKPQLIIMVDCGSNSREAINYLKLNKIKSIIVDHHQIYKPFPLANEIINPNKNLNYINYNYLCATTLTYFLIDILLSRKIVNSNIKLESNLILVLLATVCDVMPIRKLNRILSIKTLNSPSTNKFISFKIIKDKILKNKKITIEDLGFIIGPILNSGGRLGHSDLATKLLSSNNENEISKISNKLIALNEKRKNLENKSLKRIDLNKLSKKHNEVVFIYDSFFKDGLIGIIASKLKDQFNKPAFVMTQINSTIKGSARSVINFDIGKILHKALDKNLINSGGGHQMAGGFQLNKNNLETFKLFLNKEFKNHYENNEQFIFESKLSLSSINSVFISELNKLEPFGTANENPIFLFENLKIKNVKIIKNKHIFNLFISNNGKTVSAISFNSVDNPIGKYLLNYKKQLNVIGYLKENFWNNKKTLQLVVLDLIL
ncbi:MAG: single-stranded-DNA-specific exonuclease RecJ [Candidatus Pelagibacter bacterium]|jgi:single-stranded-DNA-specific exonuclease|nr:single-stranded-DNA-specific exonuclease RecJ [Candidatus Pelagibacter bacterium]